MRIRPNGDIILYNGDWFTETTRQSMNDVLRHLNMEVVYTGRANAGQWFVVDDQQVRRPYEHNMVIAGSQPAHRQRGRKILEVWGIAVPASMARAASTMPQAGQPLPQPRSAAAAPTPAARSAAPAAAQPAGPSAPAAASGAAHTWAAMADPRDAAAAPPSAAPPPLAARGGYAAAEAVNAAPPVRPPQPRRNVQEQLAEAVKQMGIDEDEADDEMCVVCMARAREIVLVPCGHLVLCKVCCDHILANKALCPVCNVDIIEHVEIKM